MKQWVVVQDVIGIGRPCSICGYLSTLNPMEWHRIAAMDALCGLDQTGQPQPWESQVDVATRVGLGYGGSKIKCLLSYEAH